jgi:hypothetical protein
MAHKVRCRPGIWQTSRHLIGEVIQPARVSGRHADSNIPHKR